MLAAAAFAQSAWPRRPVRLPVGVAPGGFCGIVARAVAEQYTQRLGVNVVVENRSGAWGTLAMDFVAEAPSRRGAEFREFVALEISRYKAVLGKSQIPL